MRMTSVVCNVPVLSQNDSTYHHSVFTTWKWHPFATWTPSFIIIVRKLEKFPKNTNGRLAIPALAGLLVCIWNAQHNARSQLQRSDVICEQLFLMSYSTGRKCYTMRPVSDGWVSWPIMLLTYKHYNFASCKVTSVVTNTDNESSTSAPVAAGRIRL